MFSAAVEITRKKQARGLQENVIEDHIMFPTASIDRQCLASLSTGTVLPCGTGAVSSHACEL